MGSISQGDLNKENIVSSDDTVVLDHGCSRVNVNSDFANSRPNSPPQIRLRSIGTLFRGSSELRRSRVVLDVTSPRVRYSR